MGWPLKREYKIDDLAHDVLIQSEKLGFGAKFGERFKLLDAVHRAYGPAFRAFPLMTAAEYLMALNQVLNRMRCLKEHRAWMPCDVHDVPLDTNEHERLA